MLIMGKNVTIFFDLERAFDTVNHEVSLSMLKEYGTKISCNFTLIELLHVIVKEINVRDQESKWFQLGSCLGLLLLITYADDSKNYLENIDPRN